MEHEWTTDHQEFRGQVGQSAMYSARCGFYLEHGNREYLISADGDRWALMIRIASHEYPALAFNSDAEARQYAENWEATRPARVAEGYHYAAKHPDITEATRHGFGDLWSDKYSLEGVTLAGAWEDYKNG